MPVSWQPSLAQVAAYAPWLTVNTKVPGSQAYVMTFDDRTSPDGTVAGQHLGDAVTLIGGRVPLMPADLAPAAAVVAARYAAATLAVAYARTDEDRVRAAALLALAESALKAFYESADSEGADSLSALPVLIAPLPVPWGDSLLIDGRMPTYRQYLWPE